MLHLPSRRAIVFRLAAVRLGAVAIVVLSLAAKTNGLMSANKIFDRVVADNIPTSWKRTTDSRPRACSAIEKTLAVATRAVLFRGGELNVVVEAASNRDALRGKLSRFSIAARDSKSALPGVLAVDRWTVEGSDLRLGWRPLLATAGLPLALAVRPLRQLAWTLSIWSLQWMVAKRLIAGGMSAGDGDNGPGAAAKTPSKDSNSLARRMEAAEASVGKRIRKVLGGSPCRLGFEMVLSDSNLRDSSLLRLTSTFLLRFLMKNSILQTAAAVGDAVSDNPSPPPYNKPRRQNLLLPGEAEPPSYFGNLDDNSSPNNKSKFSRLLSATAFELREPPTFHRGSEDGQNYLQFSSVAILPEDRARLDFVLRTTLAVAGGPSELIRFVRPECRFDVTEATSSLPLPRVVSNLLPKELWLPIGSSGVAIGREEGDLFSIRDIRVVSGGGTCRIEGDLSLLQKATPPPRSGGGLVRR